MDFNLTCVVLVILNSVGKNSFAIYAFSDAGGDLCPVVGGKIPTNVLYLPKPSAGATDSRKALAKTSQPKHVNAAFSSTALFATCPVGPKTHRRAAYRFLIPARKLSRQS